MYYCALAFSLSAECPAVGGAGSRLHLFSQESNTCEMLGMRMVWCGDEEEDGDDDDAGDEDGVVMVMGMGIRMMKVNTNNTNTMTVKQLLMNRTWSQ